jgi:hypothetical protein
MTNRCETRLWRIAKTWPINCWPFSSTFVGLKITAKDSPGSGPPPYLQPCEGLTSSYAFQVLLIFVGEGSAGKSVFLALLRKLLGAAFRDVGKEIQVKSKGQRAAQPLEAGENFTRTSSLS